MSDNQNAKKKQKVKMFHGAAEGYKVTVKATRAIWDKSLTNLEHSLENLRDELFGADEEGELSITGQIVTGEIAERSGKLIRESLSAHKEIYNCYLKMGKIIEKAMDRPPSSSFKIDECWGRDQVKRQCTASMIYDMTVAEGLTRTGNALKKESLIDKDEIHDPYTLKQIVDDLREGEIVSSMDYLETSHPVDENCIMTDLQTQMITDCIETDDYGKAVDQMKQFNKPWSDLPVSKPMLIGALLVGKSSLTDDRYRYLFDKTAREVITTKMQSFFIPQDSPLRLILRYGSQSMAQLAELGINGLDLKFYGENEMPLEVSINPTHSSFTCPILKEQCSEENPPIRLICGHVISKDAVSRLNNSLRTIRNSGRTSRFKCPYCPKEQYIDTTRVVEFDKWPDDDDGVEDRNNLPRLYNGYVPEFPYTNGIMNHMYN